MVASSVRNMKLTSYDDIFSTEETRQAERQQTEVILNVPISEVHDFAENPYQVRQDAELMAGKSSAFIYEQIKQDIIRRAYCAETYCLRDTLSGYNRRFR